jgi:peptidoglycan/xylan/chitin deacetylase (PgdA/CDA1 family)
VNFTRLGFFKKIFFLAAFMFFVLFSAMAFEYQPCHRVTLTQIHTVLENRSHVTLWYADTSLDSVDRALRSLVDNYANIYLPTLTILDSKEGAAARLDIIITYSRTGVSWLSFMVMVRLTQSGHVRSTEFTTRSYDMSTGSPVYLHDLFEETNAVWGIIEAGVRKAFLRNYPDTGCNTRVVEQILRRENLYRADFTLHGMSLVLHYPASRLFEGKSSIIQIPFYYPELYGHMTADAFRQTDNKRYYQMVSLTYDDGPSRRTTSRLLTTLMTKGVRATFFISGNKLSNEAVLVRREHDEGHAIGGHNWLHTDVTGWPSSAIRAIRPRLDRALTQTTGVPSSYNRAPYGRFQPLLAARSEWALIQWSVNTGDIFPRSPENILNTVVNQTKHGDIIVCHDTNQRCDLYTGMIIEKLENDGFLFLTIDEMFAKDRVPFLNNLVYYRCDEGDFSSKK